MTKFLNLLDPSLLLQPWDTLSPADVCDSEIASLPRNASLGSLPVAMEGLPIGLLSRKPLQGKLLSIPMILKIWGRNLSKAPDGLARSNGPRCKLTWGTGITVRS